MVKLNAKIRKQESENLLKIRQEEKLPGVCYGSKMENTLVSVDYKEFIGVLNETEGSSLFDLDIEGKSFPVVIKEMQKDSLTGKVVHVDFYHVLMDKKIEVNVPLVFIGEAPAVKNLGGILIKNFQSITIKVLPGQIPKHIEVDISKLKTFEDEISADDLKIPEGADLSRGLKDTIAFVIHPTAAEDLEKPTDEEETTEGEIKGDESEEKKESSE